MDVVDTKESNGRDIDNADIWTEKYRPSTTDDIVAHDEIITILNKLIESNKLPHLLFHGPPGTGKTTTILACAKKMYGPHYSSMTLELNASDDRGIDVVRDQIKEFAGTLKLFRYSLSFTNIQIFIYMHTNQIHVILYFYNI